MFWAAMFALLIASCEKGTESKLAEPACRTEQGPAIWTRQCVSGFAQGEGVATFADNYIATLEGKLVNGVPEGVVNLVYSDGDTYEGELRNGDFHGFGKFMGASLGEGYEGNWNEGFRDGYGVYIAEDGRRIPGTWRRGGLAASWYADPKSGCRFWWSPDANPTGEATWSGDCLDRKATGAGRIYWNKLGYSGELESEIEFEGSVVAGVMQGAGLWRRADYYSNVTQKTTFEGQWVDGKRNGPGQETRASDYVPSESIVSIVESYRGVWKDDEWSGAGRHEEVRESRDGMRQTLLEEGLFADHKLDGDGRRFEEYRWPDGRRNTREQEGVLSDGWLVGRGSSSTEVIDSEGRYYQQAGGDWAPDGIILGKATYPDGARFEGSFFGGGEGMPKAGRCEIPAKRFSGECESRGHAKSSYSSVTCLVPKGRNGTCLKEIGSITH